jgi:thioredoxin reductase (NADPH)
MERMDIAIIGCGPAGLSAAVNAVIRRASVVLLGGEICAPKLQQSTLVNNYLGLPEINGQDLRDKFLEHTRKSGIPMRQVRVTSVQENRQGGFTVLAGDKAFEARAVVLATGVTVLKLIDGEKEFAGKGLGYCATCDGPLYRGKNVAVIAYTEEGIEDAKFLAGICRRVYLITGNGLPTKDLKPEVEVIKANEIQGITGNGFVSGVKLEGDILAVDGVFIYRETYLPDRLVPGLILKDNHIQVDRGFGTNIKGLYAAGDCTGKPYQLAKAVGEGQVAALNTVKYLEQLP